MSFTHINNNPPGYFHWSLSFPEILIKGGFDICLGNPPYGRSILTIAEKDLLKISYILKLQLYYRNVLYNYE